MTTLLEAVKYSVMDKMERKLWRDMCDDKDIDVDERILDIVRVAAIFDGREDDFERYELSARDF